jgi:hypothetical protein
MTAALTSGKNPTRQIDLQPADTIIVSWCGYPSAWR